MGYPAYSYYNWVDFASTGLSSSTQDSAFPRANLHDEIKAHPFKFTTNGGWIEINFGASFVWNSLYVAILGHNMTNLTSGTVKVGAAPNPSTLVGTFTYRAEDMWVNTGTNTFQYMRIDLTHTGATTSIGELVVSAGAGNTNPRITLPRAPRWGIVKGKEARGVTHRTYGGVTWDFEHYTMGFLRPTFRFPESEYATFQALSDSVGRDPFLWIPDIEAAPIYYVKKQRGFAPAPVAPGMDSSTLALWYDWTVEMESESIGLTVNS